MTSFLRIFMNHPKLTSHVPEGDLHHFRDVAFFCCGTHAPAPAFVFDVTSHLKKLKRNGESPAQRLNVQIFAGALRGAAPRIVPALIQLSIAKLVQY